MKAVGDSTSLACSSVEFTYPATVRLQQGAGAHAVGVEEKSRAGRVFFAIVNRFPAGIPLYWYHA
jgi:hypothetical protein